MFLWAGFSFKPQRSIYGLTQLVYNFGLWVQRQFYFDAAYSIWLVVVRNNEQKPTYCHCLIFSGSILFVIKLLAFFSADSSLTIQYFLGSFRIHGFWIWAKCRCNILYAYFNHTPKPFHNYEPYVFKPHRNEHLTCGNAHFTYYLALRPWSCFFQKETSSLTQQDVLRQH